MGPVMSIGFRIKGKCPKKLHSYLGKPTLVSLPATTLKVKSAV